MPKCRVFRIDEDLDEMVANGLYMKSLLGTDVSVSIVKFVEANGSALPSKAHSHGEEATLQVVGACSVFEGERTPESDPERRLEESQAMIIPAGLSHYGANRFNDQGVCMRFNVVTPPRKEFGKSGDKPYYPLKDGAGS